MEKQGGECRAGQYEVLICWTVLDGAVTISRSDSTEVCNAPYIQLEH